MCNISGYIGVKKGNINILKLLAIVGRLRGTDSTGFYFNEKLHKFASPGDSLDILNGVCIYYNKKNINNVFMIHNRARTVGASTVDNAHPYEYNYIPNRHFIFMHNGTIKNIVELCNKYKIEHSHSKTDSYHFGKILYEHGTKVLSEYEGFAAIAAYDVNKGILYLFKGSSQCEADKVVKDERPLHIYKKPGLLYFNSTIEGLVTSLNTLDNIEEFPANELIGFNNKAEEVSRLKIDRSHIKYSYPVYSNSDYDWSKYPNQTNKTTQQALSIEPSPQNKYGTLIYFWRGCHYKNGHLLDGIYSIDAAGNANNISEKTYSNYVLSGLDLNDIYFFYKGFMIKNYDTYQDLVKANKYHQDYVIYDFAQKLHAETIYMRIYASGTSVALYRNGVSVAYQNWVRPKWSCFRYKVSYNGIDYEEITDLVNDKKVLTNAYNNDDDNDELILDSFQKALF